jgi:hypothetical protein
METSWDTFNTHILHMNMEDLKTWILPTIEASTSRMGSYIPTYSTLMTWWDQLLFEISMTTKTLKGNQIFMFLFCIWLLFGALNTLLLVIDKISAMDAELMQPQNKIRDEPVRQIMTRSKTKAIYYHQSNTPAVRRRHAYKTV